MSEPSVERYIERLNLIRKHLQHAGMGKADRYVEAAIAELVRVTDKSGSSDADPKREN